MNYRHAFHAGNFADCMKHALLVWLLRALARKPAAFAVLDTHAGAGRYDLSGDPAQRTGEWRTGIGCLLDDPPAALADYVAVVQREGLYPGSPALVRSLLRDDDRLVCCELHPEDAATLTRTMGRDPRVAVHRRDGWEALSGLLPPPQRRGLVLLDPPYEQSGDYDRVVAGLHTVAARFPAGVVAAWYPIKHGAPVRALHEAVRLAGLRDVVAAELWLREPTDPARLNGCGLLVRQPPWLWEQDWPAILAALLARLGPGEIGQAAAIGMGRRGAGWRAIRLTDE